VNKSAIKNFATRARRKLIEDITQKAYELGITGEEIKDAETFDGGFRVNGKVFKKHEIKQRQQLVSQIHQKGFDQVIEEVAYTWFNRFIALRFMEVNEYLPSGIRVLSSEEEGKTEPDIIQQAPETDLDIDREVYHRLQDNNETEDLYRYLLVKQCNELGEIMPQVFEKIADYTELLLPDNLLSEGSVIRDLVESIDEENFKDQVEIIGWLYQYYISEKKDQVFADLKKNKKITKENIPAATQLFTPKWIVKYMVENSLGRLWLESHPDPKLQAKWKYYLEEAEQEPEVQKQLEEIREKNKDLSPEDIKVLDPAMGSGHILVYAFDVLYDIYLSAGYPEREIPQLILEKNLYGLDIDDRAGQLAYFALMMKARSKNRRIFRKKIELNLCSIQESNGISKEAIEYFADGDKKLKKDLEYLVEVFHDAKEYGSILDIKSVNFDALEERIEKIGNCIPDNTFELKYKNTLLEKLPLLIKQARIMSGKYDVMCTNPPYMGRRSMNSKLVKFLDDNFKDSKSDLFAVFMELDNIFLKNKGFMGMINQQSWMFLSSFENLRKKLVNYRTIYNMLHLGPHAFEEIGGEVVQSTVFITRKTIIDNYISVYIRLTDWKNATKKEMRTLEAISNSHVCYIYKVKSDTLKYIPGSPIAYWINGKVIKCFQKYFNLGEIETIKSGLTTGDNNTFLKYWFEIDKEKIEFKYMSKDNPKRKWIPHTKGGPYRKWYGNYEYVINWDKDGEEVKKFEGSYVRNEQYYFRSGVSWSQTSSNNFSARLLPKNFIINAESPALFCNDKDLYYYLALFNSRTFNYFIMLINPTLHFLVGDISKVPILKVENNKIKKYSNENTKIAKTDWDSFETSWDFKKHPIITHKDNATTIEEAFNNWSDFAEKQFNQLKANEEELNRIFIDIYGLQDELTPEVDEKDVTIRKADKERDIKSFISYAVGCMFGRYSLDEEGLIYAGGQFDISRYKKFIPTKDNIIPILDDDYFENDAVNRFVEFVKVTFGEETLEENLDYIAETLGKRSKETSRQAIRRYFLKNFFKDHVRTYKKRPIYWLFDSGKQNGFKALIYLHRYEPTTVARVRTDYLHELQKKYEAEINRLEMVINSDVSNREKTAARKRREKISKQLEECIAYDQVLSHVANQQIEIDLDDGVKVNYAKFQGIEVPQGEGKKPLKANLLAKI